jgi:hypothetical protein
MLRPLFLAAVLAVLLVVAARRAPAHDVWANNEPVPAWIKSACCGEADAHVLEPGDYWIDKEGFHIKAVNRVVDLDKILPSQDGKVWAFYSVVGENVNVYCVFYSGSI